MLSHEGIIAVEGVDTDKFLQGQLTCDLKSVTGTTATLGARCNPKGRMQSSFYLWRTDQGVMLGLDRQLIAAQLADLGKYAVFYKCELSDQSDNRVGFGIWGEAADAALQSCSRVGEFVQYALAGQRRGGLPNPSCIHYMLLA